MRRRQRGVTTVEFAIIGAVMLTVLFAIMEFGRALFVASALAEGTRRGARSAAVCPVGDPMPAQVAIFADADGVSRIAPNLTTANVAISYLTADGAVITNPAGSFNAIRYVRASIVNYQQQMLIPFVLPSFLMPSFVATLPIESLGYGPTPQAFVPCTPP